MPKTPPKRAATDDRPDMRGMHTRQLEFRPATADDESRSVEVVLSTEGAVPVTRGKRRLDEVLLADGMRIRGDRIPLLDTHNRTSVSSHLGSIRDLRAESGQVLGRLHFGDTEQARGAWSLVRDGHLTDVSVGWMAESSVYIRRNSEADVGGRRFRAGAERDMVVVPRWRALEGSITSIGADEAAQVRELEPADDSEKGAIDMDKDLREFIEARGFDPDALDEAQVESMRAFMAADADDDSEDESERAFADFARAHGFDPATMTDAQRTGLRTLYEVEAPTPRIVNAEDAARRAVETERARCRAIREEGAGIDEALVRKCIDDGLSIDAARAVFLAKLRGARTASVGAPPTPGGTAAVEKMDDDVFKRMLAQG